MGRRGAAYPRARRAARSGRTPGTGQAVVRTALLNRLCGAADGTIATIVAPAGYGKTTLLAQWAERDPRPVLWSRPRAGGRRSRKLVESRLAADRRGARASRARRRRARAPLAAGARRVRAAARAQTAHGTTRRVSRRDARRSCRSPALRAEGRLLEIGADELALKGRDAETLLRRAGVLLPRQEAAALAERLEGWPAALFLAALSLRSGAQASTVSGDDRFLADYLETEHLAGLSRAQRQFALQTSVLDGADVGGVRLAPRAIRLGADARVPGKRGRGRASRPSPSPVPVPPHRPRPPLRGARAIRAGRGARPASCRRRPGSSRSARSRRHSNTPPPPATSPASPNWPSGSPSRLAGAAGWTRSSAGSTWFPRTTSRTIPTSASRPPGCTPCEGERAMHSTGQTLRCAGSAAMTLASAFCEGSAVVTAPTRCSTTPTPPARRFPRATPGDRRPCSDEPPPCCSPATPNGRRESSSRRSSSPPRPGRPS